MMRRILVLLCMILLLTGCGTAKEVDGKNDIKQDVQENTCEEAEIYINDIYLDNEDCVVDQELFWANITITTTENETLQDYYASMDLDGNIHAKIDIISGYFFYKPISSEKIALKDENGSIIVVDENNDLTATYCTGNEYIKFVQEDDTGITVWVQEDIETFEKNESILKALDENGNVKFETSTDFLKESYGFTWCEFSEIWSIGGTTYQMRDCGLIEDNYHQWFDLYFNIESGLSMSTSDDSSGSSDGTYTMRAVGHNVVIWDQNGTITYDSRNDNRFKTDWVTAESAIVDGIFYCVLGSGWNEKYCVMNYKGDVVFYLEDVRNNPYYHNGSAPISIISANGEGIPYTTFMDASGNWLFEPVEGDFKSYIKSLNMCKILQKDNSFCFLDKNGKKWNNYEGVSCYAKRNDVYYYVFLENGKLDILEFVEK